MWNSFYLNCIIERTQLSKSKIGKGKQSFFLIFLIEGNIICDVIEKKKQYDTSHIWCVFGWNGSLNKKLLGEFKLYVPYVNLMNREGFILWGFYYVVVIWGGYDILVFLYFFFIFFIFPLLLPFNFSLRIPFF